MNVAGFVCMSDEELIVHTMRKAQSLLAEHIDRGAYDAEEALTQLLEILDRQDVVAATDRLCREYGLRPLNETVLPSGARDARCGARPALKSGKPSGWIKGKRRPPK